MRTEIYDRGYDKLILFYLGKETSKIHKRFFVPSGPL